MTMPVQVSIVMPVFNDEDWVADAIDSCLAQSVKNIEVICVDDASTDATRDIILDFQRRDPRVRLIAHERNQSAFQARRTGIAEATGAYILFLDGDDELAPDAVKLSLAKAKNASADVVGFGVEIVSDDGVPMKRFESTMQPNHRQLRGAEIVRGIFPAGEPAQGHIWRYLFKATLLRNVYDGFTTDLSFYRANDMPIVFLAMAEAESYISTPQKLYRYRFGRGKSGRNVGTIEDFRFYLSAIDAIDAIAERVKKRASSVGDPGLTESYDSARLSMISNVLKYCARNTPSHLHGDCIALLEQKVGALQVIRAAVMFFEDALPLLARHLQGPQERDVIVKHVLLTTGNLRTGGVQGVLVAQAGYLRDAGFSVTVAIHDARGIAYELPAGVEMFVISGKTAAERVASWLQIVRDNSIDLVIDHHVFYNERWPYLVLAARSIGVPTIGWLHNFALRPLFDSRDRTSFLVEYLPLLRQVIVLSPTDVAFWKMRGVERVAFLPNPPSPLSGRLPERVEPRTAPDGTIELAWWGRLQQSTKQVCELIRLAENLRNLDVDFRITIIGPDGDDLTMKQLRQSAERAGVADAVRLPGPMHGDDLAEELSEAHLLVSTSVIEGYPLTITEAQTLGMPVILYDLPWMMMLNGNAGVVAVPQGDVEALAAHVAELAVDRKRYTALSRASIAAAGRMRSVDFSALYAELVTGRLRADFSPEPTMENARLLLDWTFFYAERNMRLLDDVTRARETSRGLSSWVGRRLPYIPRRVAKRILSGMKRTRSRISLLLSRLRDR